MENAQNEFFARGPPQLQGGRTWRVATQVTVYFSDERINCIERFEPFGPHSSDHPAELIENETEISKRLVIISWEAHNCVSGMWALGRLC